MIRFKRPMTPNPGSDAARKGGCTCPVRANHHGRGLKGVADVFVRKPGCPLHGYLKIERKG